MVTQLSSGATELKLRNGPRPSASSAAAATWLAVTFWIFTPVSALLLGAHQDGGPSYDVVPWAWITSDGSLPRGFPADARNGQAFVFPSLEAGDTVHEVSASTPSPFFKPSNKFPQTDVFSWRSIEGAVLRVQVSRQPDNSAVITLDAQSMRALRNLNWPTFQNVQRMFRRWLLCKAGCTIFTDPKERFVNFDQVLTSFWRGAVLTQARFAEYARLHLNDPEDPEVSYGESPALLMRATPIKPPETLFVSWGTTALYPVPIAGLGGGATRFSVGGSTELQVARRATGVALFPPGTPRLSSLTQQFDQVGSTVLLPFPLEMAGLFGRVFVPIYTPLDLYNERVLRYKTGDATEPFDDRLPTHLVLLTPSVYVKAEPNDAARRDVAQFATDARVKPTVEPTLADQLTRRYILIGLTEYTPTALARELKRLLDGVINGGPAPNERGHVMAVFANQTSLQVRRHIAVNGRVLETSEPRRQTWAQVIDRAMAALLLDTSAPSSPPALIVRRIGRQADGTPFGRMTVRVHVADHVVLDAAQIAEGDDFEQSPHLSKGLR